MKAEEKAKLEAEATLEKLENASNTTQEIDATKAKTEGLENTDNTTQTESAAKAKTEKKSEAKKTKTVKYDHAVKVNGKWYYAGEDVPLIK